MTAREHPEPERTIDERRGPIRFRLAWRRCSAWFVDGAPTAKATDCGRLIWPWQRLVREWDPECGGRLVHHDCHHRATEGLWRPDYGDGWTEWLHCEHVTDPGLMTTEHPEHQEERG